MNGDTILDALQWIDPDCEYADWIRVGMALEAEGYDCDVWDEWSSNGGKYTPGRCEKLWRGFHDRPGGVTGATIVQLAQNNGFVPEHKEIRIVSHKGKAKKPISQNTQNDVIVPVNTPIAQNGENGWRLDNKPLHGAAALQKYLQALHDDEDKVCIVAESLYNEETRKYSPGGKGNIYTVGELVEKLNYQDIGAALESYPNENAGAWIRVNPMKRALGRDVDVDKFKYALVESDVVSIKEQKEIYESLQLPIAALVDSGGKSVHAIVKIDAKNAQEYKKRVSKLHKVLDGYGLEPDKADKNPSRLSRMPGVIRDGREQLLLGTNLGASSWDVWWNEIKIARATELEKELGLKDTSEIYKEDIPEPVDLVEGLLRVGGELEITGKKKTKKTWLALQLAQAIAKGGKFLGMRCRKSRVLYCNLELRDEAIQLRNDAIKTTLGDNVKGLKIYTPNRDELPHEIARKIATLVPKYDVVILDPIYMLLDGDENTTDTMHRFIKDISEIESEGVTVIYTHHQSKGAQGDKDVGDRGNGSGLLSRHYDACCDILKLEGVPANILPNPDAQAYRLEFETREHKDKPKLDCWFQYPTWVEPNEEEKAALAKCGPKGSAAYATQCNAQKGEQTTADIIDAIEETLQDRGITRVSIIAEKVGVSEKTVRNKLKSMPGYAVEGGMIRAV